MERINIERIVRRMERVQSEIDSIRGDLLSLLGESIFAPPDYMKRSLRLWRKISDVGGTVTKTQLHAIARGLGYDLRGLGGFFAGPNSSLVEIGNDRIALRKWAAEEVDKYRAWLDEQRS